MTLRVGARCVMVTTALCVLLAAWTLAGCEKRAVAPEVSAPRGGEPTVLSLSSPAFSAGGTLPAKYAMKAAGGENISPPLEWTGAPTGAQSFALTVVDANPVAKKWVHWMIVDIPPDARGLTESISGKLSGGLELRNTFGSVGWGGPQPPPGTGAHEYQFTLYALDTAQLPIGEGASLADFQAAVASHELAVARISATFQR